jgi:hypothetical protein
VTDCPVLPPTGATSLTEIVLTAMIVFALGVVMVLVARRWGLPILAVVLAAGVLAVAVALAVPARAATTCPPSSSTPSVSPTSTPTSPTSPSSTTTTSTSTSTTTTTPTSTSSTTTVAGTPPTANGDDEIFTVGVAFSLNVLTNDVLGSPPATISAFTLGAGPVCAGVTFDQGTGVLSGTLSVPLLPCLLSYTLTNSAGSSSAVAAVTGGPAPTTSTTTTVPGTPPTANGDDGIFPVGVPFSLNVLTNDVLGTPPATISAFTIPAGPVCAGVSFDQGTGVLSGTLSVPLLPCLVSYTLTNSAGSSTAVASLTGA